MNAEKEVPIFGSYWQVRVHVFGANFAIRIVCQSAPQNPFGGVNCHLVANLGLRRGHQPNYRIRNIQVGESLRANTPAQNSDSESIPNSRHDT